MKRLAYHDQDPDGWMSAAILLKKFPDIELCEVSKSGEKVEIKSGYDEVYVVDHSLWGEKYLKQARDNNRRLIWIDHHKSAIDTFAKDYEGLRDVNYAACILTWKYCFPKKDIPKAVFHIGDEDLWKFENDKTETFSSFLRTIKQSDTIKEYVKLLDKTDLSREYDIGTQVEKYQANILEEMYVSGIKRAFDGHLAMIFDGEVLRSKLANIALQRNPDIAIAVVRKTAYIKDNKEYFKYSIRSREGESITAKEICVKHGGGGHPCAGAFVSLQKF